MLKELNDAMEYIEAHLEDEFLLEKISEHINVSDYHFRKIFFALTNMTLNEYVKIGGFQKRIRSCYKGHR